MPLEEFIKTPVVFVNVDMSKKERKKIAEPGHVEFYKGTRYFSIGKLKLEDYEFLHQAQLPFGD